MHTIYDYLERLSNLQRADARQSLAEYGLQPVQLEALHYLSVCNRYSDTPMAVTEYLGQTKGTVSQTLKVLEKKGLLTRQADTTDKRMTHLKVSAAGANILQAVIPSPMFINAGKQLGKQAQTEIIGSLNTLLVALQRANNMKPFGACRTCRHNRKLDDGGYFCNLTRENLSARDVQLICREHQQNSGSRQR